MGTTNTRNLNPKVCLPIEQFLKQNSKIHVLNCDLFDEKLKKKNYQFSDTIKCTNALSYWNRFIEFFLSFLFLYVKLYSEISLCSCIELCNIFHCLTIHKRQISLRFCLYKSDWLNNWSHDLKTLVYFSYSFLLGYCRCKKHQVS